MEVVDTTEARRFLTTDGVVVRGVTLNVSLLTPGWSSLTLIGASDVLPYRSTLRSEMSPFEPVLRKDTSQRTMNAAVSMPESSYATPVLFGLLEWSNLLTETVPIEYRPFKAFETYTERHVNARLFI